MDMSRILIAKTGKTASEWLPLAVHLEDTAGIMQCMLRDMIPPSFPESCALSPEAFEKRLFCKCWGKRKQRSCEINQMRTAL